MWKRDDDQEQISTKDLQMRVECSTMKGEERAGVPAARQ